MRSSVLLVATLLLWPAMAAGGEADIVGAEVHRQGDGNYRFSVSVRHADEGWKHYADKWDVLAPDGSVLGTRELLHPHVDEQPFTRSLSGVRVPEGIDKVTIRAHDSIHGYGGAEMQVNLR